MVQNPGFVVASVKPWFPGQTWSDSQVLGFLAKEELLDSARFCFYATWAVEGSDRRAGHGRARTIQAGTRGPDDLTPSRTQQSKWITGLSMFLEA